MSKSKHYYIEESYSSLYNAGILRKHHELQMSKMGFVPLRFTQVHQGNIFVKINRIVQAIKMAFIPGKKSLVFFHFPILAKAHALVLNVLKWRGIPTVAIIVDIDGLRDNNPSILKAEIYNLAKFKYIVAHNAAMKQYILEHLPNVKVLTIELFDYHAAAPGLAKTFSTSVCIAANHSKGQYVYQLQQLMPVQFYLYGEGYNSSLQPAATNVHYQGVVAPETLPALAVGSFGLVWDGPSLTNCDAYLLYNNPHKLSLYLTAGMPVIVWEKSAVAAFVKKHQIGITIETLTGLNNDLSKVSEETYNLMQQNATALGQKAGSGWYLKNIIDKIQANARH
ncbi:MAG TPA: hypothetical protein PKC39_09975 [Ferruginibacter sp.]|mgnify:CR=1 FL=1|nr:hypothetical protein [Ferruginibacter sp.]HMP21276.1 hypothetical protein [Ferruginibacter sp.]